MDASVRGLKTWRTHDGGGYQATLCLNGRPVAVVTNEGMGGAMRWDVTEWEPFVKWAALHHVTVTPTGPLPCDSAIDDEMARLIDTVETDRWLRRNCRTKTIFRLPEDTDGEYRTINAPYSDKVRDFILSKYPTAIIANERI